MSCKEWNTDWIARLYDELAPDERRRMDRHLDACPECRATFDRLTRTSRLVRAAAPAVPASPRVVVLETRRTWPVVWTFAAGAACALLVFGIGLALGPRLNPSTPTGDPVSAVRADAGTAALRDQVAALERRIAELQRAEVRPATHDDEQLRQAIDQLERRFDRARSQDLDFLMQAITASEMRTGQWLDRTHDALNLLALRQDPTVSER